MSLLKNYLPDLGGSSVLYFKSNPLSRKGFSLLMIFLVFSAIAGNASIYYVSTSGNDSNSGTTPDNPWKSLTKVNNFTPQPGDQILFNRGDEWVGTITVSASGLSGNPVVYGAYGTGSNPKIYGSEEITGWKLHSGKIYKATVNSTVEQLFVNNSRAMLARYPNSGYFNTTIVNSSTQFTSTDLDGGINYTGATWIGRTTAFTIYHRNVTGSGSQTVTLESAPSYGLGVGRGFFLTNKLEFLDQAGEWFYDISTKTVYLWAPNGDSPANYEVRGSTSAYGVNISGMDYIVIKDFDILHSSNTGVYINKANYITIDNNRIFSPDLFGIHMPSNSNSPVFKNNYIYQAGGGIRCYGTSAIISDNTVEDTGLLEDINKSVFTHDNYATAIFSRNNYPTITYNRIINAGYNGINWKGINGDISYNYIDGACQVLDDGGGIYTYNGYDYKLPASAGSVVKSNIVLNVYGNPEGYEKNYFLGFGIYMDNAVHHVTIENNTVAGATGALFINPCGLINVRNNTFMDATLLLLIHDEFEKSTITGNIFYTTSRGGYFKWWGENADQRIVYQESGASAIYDHNKYIAHYGVNDVFVNMKSFADWKAKTGQDASSSFDGSPMGEGETEQLFYNDTKQSKTFNLGNSVYRDIDGKQVTGSFTLEPFTSRILIGKNFDDKSGDNQSPVILDQLFDILAPKTGNDFVGQVSASDPDAGQTLNYSIVQGNEDGLFSINGTTGIIYTNRDIQTSVNQTIVLNVEVTDDADIPLSASAKVTINITGAKEIIIPDTTAPTISSFSIPQAATSLAVSVTAFTATDDREVTGYKLTETSTTPLAGEDGWAISAPVSYFFLQGGIKTLYAWAKDAAGNVSVSRSGTVSITLENKELLPSMDSVENIAICEGEAYMGWTASGVYERVLSSDTIIQSKGINQIPNYNFSNGTGGWTKWSASGYSINLVANSQDYISSPASMQVNCTANGTSVSSLQLITGGAISVEVGKEYELTFYAKATVEFNIGRLYIHQAISPWTKYGAFAELSPKITTNWKEYRIRFTATHTAADAQLRVYLGNSLPAGQSLFLDDVSFAEFTENKVQINQTIITYLTVNPTQYSTEDITITEGDDYLGWTASGVYERTLLSVAGCDSLVTTNLTVSIPVIPEPVMPLPEKELITEYVTICQGAEYMGRTASGVYERVQENLVITTYLTVTLTQYSTEDIAITGGENYLGWTASGVYERTLLSAAGCDSIVTTNLTVVSFSRRPKKKTAVITSLAGWRAPNVNDFVLYPNPARSYINIDYTFQPEDTKIEILDGSGRTLYNQKAESVSSRINTSHLPSGVYFLRSLQGQQQKVIKFIIQ